MDKFFPTSTLVGYPDQLLNPYSEQWTFGIQSRLKPNWVLSVDYVGSHTFGLFVPWTLTRRLLSFAPRPARPAPRKPPTARVLTGSGGISKTISRVIPRRPTNPQPPYALIQTDVNNGFSTYQALDVNLTPHVFASSFHAGELCLVAQHQ